METVRILNGEMEKILVTTLSSTGVLLTGLIDILLEIRRNSDGFYLDFNDLVFKTAGWTTRQKIMTELDATNSAGVYYYDFNTSGYADDTYFFRATSATAYNMPQESELKVGGYVNDIASETSLMILLTNTLQLREGNQRRTLMVATIDNAVRKVAVGKLDHIIIETKNDTDPADFSVIRDTKTLYAWYTTLGDTNPVKLGENG